MIAADTNIVVRLITLDDPAQAARARRLFAREQVWLAQTVLLETAWVLRSVYGFDDHEVASAIRKLAGLPNVHLEDEIAVAQALLWLAGGVDFVDAIHLASRGEASAFVTFDERFAKKMSKLDVAVEVL